MKRLVLVILGLAVLGSSLAAQDRDSRRHNRFQGPGPERNFAAEQLTLTGTLGLRRGVIVLESEDRVWYTPGLRPYAGFIEGLKAGAVVTLEGWGWTNPRPGETNGFLRVSKLTLDGKDYDLEGPALAWDAVPRGNHHRPAPYSYGPRNRRRPGRDRGPGGYQGWGRDCRPW
jgi:hypothetical protein